MSRTAVSIVVPCRNEESSIRAFLDSLMAQDLTGLDWEVIVADGMSSDRTRAALNDYARRDKRIRVLENGKRTAAAGLNAAIAASRGEIIVRMDAHSEYAPDYVRQCVAVLMETGACNVGGSARTRTAGFVQAAVAAAYISPFSTGGARFHDESYEGPVDTVTYGCWRKETLVGAGLFDEALVRNQDDELNLRLSRGGGVIWQSPRIRSWYQPRNTLKGLFLQYFQYGFWKVAVIVKHRLPASWRHLAPGAFVAANMALPAAALVAQALGAAAARWLWWIWICQAALYAAASILAAGQAASKRGWMLFPALPLVFAIYHFSYGLGFLAGMAHFLGPAGRRGGPGDLFTGLNR